MDIYSNAVYCNLDASENVAGHALFAHRAGYSEYLSDGDHGVASHALWLFQNELRHATCPGMVGIAQCLVAV